VPHPRRTGYRRRVRVPERSPRSVSSIGTRVMAVADVAESGTPYDPKVVDAVFRALNEGRRTLHHAP
jgi:hypothetical protein